MKQRSDESGTSAIELVLYTPLLMITIIIVVQFSLVYLAQQTASSAAREAARTARVTGDPAMGQARGVDVAGQIGGGVLKDTDVKVVRNGDIVSATVSGHASQLLPFIGSPTVTETISGRVEEFVPDS